MQVVVVVVVVGLPMCSLDLMIRQSHSFAVHCCQVWPRDYRQVMWHVAASSSASQRTRKATWRRRNQKERGPVVSALPRYRTYGCFEPFDWEAANYLKPTRSMRRPRGCCRHLPARHGIVPHLRHTLNPKLGPKP